MSAAAPAAGRRRRRRWGWIVLAVVALAAVVAVTFLRRGGPPAQRVLVEAVERGHFLREVSGSGVIEPARERALSFRGAGTVASLTVQEGDRVAQGQVLATLDTAALERDLASNASSLASAQAELARIEAQQRVDRLDLEGAVATAEDQVAQALQALTDAQAALDVAERLERVGAVARDDVAAAAEAVAAATRQHRQASQSLEAARVRLTGADQLAVAQRASGEASVAQLQTAAANLRQQRADAELRAPFAGVVSTVPFKVGDTITPSATAAIGLVDDATLSVVARFDENRAVELKAGQRATVTPDAAPDLVIPATVRRVSSVADRSEGAAQVVADLDFAPEPGAALPEGALRPGYTVTAKVVVNELDDVLLIPLEAIVAEGGASLVYRLVAEEGATGSVERVPLTVTDRNAILAAASSAELRAGDRIVVTNLENVSDGASVTFQVAGGS